MDLRSDFQALSNIGCNFYMKDEKCGTELLEGAVREKEHTEIPNLLRYVSPSLHIPLD